MGRKDITQAQRDEAVHLVLAEGHSTRQVCEMLDVGPTALRRWVAMYQAEHPAPGSQKTAEEDRRRVVELEAQVQKLQEERELLKKSIAFFVRESDRPRR
ncbi:transposase [Luteibacter sp. 621]|jgi:transposase|uniref:transposase n=1 Tax=Luteibacter sp. 621 TaxID=3373916 RepID=UPI003D20ABF6